MTSLSWPRFRRAVAAHGFTPASWIPAASEGRAEEAAIRPAELVEPGPFRAIPVGAPAPWPGTVAFLDGTQRYEVMAYAGASPLILAEVAAAVMERRERRLHVVEEARRQLIIARPEALDQLGELGEGYDAVALTDAAPMHPVHDVVLARQAVDAQRTRLEVQVGHTYRARSDAWLVVDGSLTSSPQWASDLRMLSVAKSHAILPFEGPDLEAYLRLPVGHRSPVFAPQSRVAPVYSWALRLWPWEGRDLLHGLVRVEAPRADLTIDLADEISRWLLAERAPVSTPDPRWDRLLYGIREVEVYLKVSGKR